MPFKVQVIAGIHSFGNKKAGTRKVYRANLKPTDQNPDTFDVETERELKFYRQYPDKFRIHSNVVNYTNQRTRLVETPPPEEVTLDELDGMGVEELKQLANGNDLDIDGLHTKDAILEAIKRQLSEELPA